MGVNVFLDTEFTDFKDCELISIGLVSEDGHHRFYAERNDFLLARCSPWALAHILPLLGSTATASMNRAALHRALRAWFDALPGPVDIVYDVSTSWCLLADILLSHGQHRIPASIGGTRSIAELKQDKVFAAALSKYYSTDRPRHHALVDAEALRAGWLAWKDRQDRRTQASAVDS